jgi:hypothetical protein
MTIRESDITTEKPVCEWCGMPIEERGQKCVALDEGVCQP